MSARSPIFPWLHAAQADLQQKLFAHVGDRAFPCVGAKAALARGSLNVLACDRIDSAWDDLRIHDALLAFVQAHRADPVLYSGFAVIFADPANLDEAAFERALWARVQSLSDKDVWRVLYIDPRVSSDPDSPHYSLSCGVEECFIATLHPRAIRPARQFERPTFLFNLHYQFERLRAASKYEGMREKIMVRDEELAG